MILHIIAQIENNTSQSCMCQFYRSSQDMQIMAVHETDMWLERYLERVLALAKFKWKITAERNKCKVFTENSSLRLAYPGIYIYDFKWNI